MEKSNRYSRFGGLSNAAINLETAERIMGWHLNGSMLADNTADIMFLEQWRPTEDANQAMIVRMKLVEHDLSDAFLEELARQVWPAGTDLKEFTGPASFQMRIFNATPRQQMVAALLAWDRKVGKQGS